MRSKANYNSVAWFYDGLSRLVFGSSIKKAQIELLHFIPEKASILIVGGGTGWILEEIAKLYPSGLDITYIDSSSKMIGLSKKRNCAVNHVQFIEAGIENTSLKDKSFDIIITPFAADGFTQEAWQQVFTKLHASLKPNGIWLYADFRLNDKSPVWQKLMIKLLYLFFKITCRIQADKLPTIDTCFSSYKLISERMYFANFIVSAVLEK